MRRPTPLPAASQPMAAPAPATEPIPTAVAATTQDAIKRTPSGPGSEFASTPPGGTVSRRGSVDIRRGSLDANHQAAIMAAAVAAMAAKRMEQAEVQGESPVKAKRQKISEGKDEAAAE